MVAHIHSSAPATDDPLVALIRAGSYRDAIGTCAREYGPALGRFCMALLGTQGEAEEATQETLIVAHDGFASYRGEGSVRAWLFGIARRLCAKRLAVRVRQERRLHLIRADHPSQSLPDDAADRGRRAHRVRSALEQLKPTEREAVVLRYQVGLSYREISEACGIEEAAARKRASRALAQLRTLLKEEVM